MHNTILFILLLIPFLVHSKEDKKHFTVEGRLANTKFVAPDTWKAIDISQIKLELKGDFDEHYSFVKKDGSFVLYLVCCIYLYFQSNEIPAGSYLLNVLSAQYVFNPVRVDISAKTGTIKASRITDKSSIPYPVKLEPEGLLDYFMIKEGFKISSLFMNPMMIMIGVSVVFIFLIPRVMSSLDEETLRELQGPTQSTEPPPKWAPVPLEQ